MHPSDSRCSPSPPPPASKHTTTHPRLRTHMMRRGRVVISVVVRGRGNNYARSVVASWAAKSEVRSWSWSEMGLRDVCTAATEAHFVLFGCWFVDWLIDRSKLLSECGAYIVGADVSEECIVCLSRSRKPEKMTDVCEDVENLAQDWHRTMGYLSTSASQTIIPNSRPICDVVPSPQAGLPAQPRSGPVSGSRLGDASRHRVRHLAQITPGIARHRHMKGDLHGISMKFVEV
jgi:hypothetical protein